MMKALLPLIQRMSWIALLLTFVLTGCAGQALLKEGNTLIEQGQIEQGLAKIQLAIEADPTSGEYRRAYILAKEQFNRIHLDKADRLRKAGNFRDAQVIYEKILGADPSNEYAKNGWEAIRQATLHADLLLTARTAMDVKDWGSAKESLDRILQDDPSHEKASAMLQELARLTAPKDIESALSVAYRKPISIEFREATIKQAFEVLTRSSGLNFIFDKDVKTDNKTSIFLRNSTVESALYFLLLSNQLEQRVMNGNTLLIYPNNANKAKEYQELSVRAFQMANTDVKSVAAALKTLFKGRDLVVDERLNMLVVRDTPEAIKLIEKIVALHDVPEPEVMLEVEVLEVNRNKLMELGVFWPTSATFAPLSQSRGATVTLNDLRQINRNFIQADVGSATVNARKVDTITNTLANPRIRVINKEKAKILIGDKLPTFTSTLTSNGVSSDSVSYQDVGLKLEVEPTIYRGNDIVIKLGLEVSSLGNKETNGKGSSAFTISTRTANTVLRLKDGENQILAGLINDEDRQLANKVPGLGELPIAGRLFGSTEDKGVRSEIILSITPRLIRNIQKPPFGIQEFRSGTETNLRDRPATPEPEEATPAPAAKGNATASDVPPVVVTGAIGSAGVDPGYSASAGKSTAIQTEEGQDETAVDEADSQGSPVSVGLSGPDKVEAGQEFVVAVNGSSEHPITSLPMALVFDTASLSVVRIEPGSWFEGTNGVLGDLSAQGRIGIQAMSRSGGISGSGAIARIVFKAQVPGSTGSVQIVKATPIGRRGALGAIVLPPPLKVTIQ